MCSIAFVIDCSHIQDIGDATVETIRKAVRDEITSRREKAKLSDDKLVLYSRRDELSSWTKSLLGAWRTEHPLLFMVYNQREDLFESGTELVGASKNVLQPRSNANPRKTLTAKAVSATGCLSKKKVTAKQSLEARML